MVSTLDLTANAGRSRAALLIDILRMPAEVLCSPARGLADSGNLLLDGLSDSRDGFFGFSQFVLRALSESGTLPGFLLLVEVFDGVRGGRATLIRTPRL